MANKQIHASVEIADHEIRLVVGEFHENHLNILRVERVRHNGVENQNIVHEGSIVNALMKACENASRVLGYKIERVLLAVPSINMKKLNGKVNVSVKSSRIQLADIQRGINEVIMSDHDENLELVNVGGIKYVINGITSRKLPLNEECDQFSMDLDLFYCDKSTLYAYANVIEKANLEILDICLGSYAIGEEAALFEQAVGNYIVLINLERQTTTLSLFSRGKLLNSEVLYEGYGEWLTPLANMTGLKSEVCVRLLSENAVLMEKDYSDGPVFLWASNEQEQTLSLKQLHDAVKPAVDKWLEMMHNACQPIVESGNCQVVLTGEGCEISGMDEVVSKIYEKAMIYVPQTIGVRDCALTTVLGMFYAWREINMIRNSKAIVADERLIDEASKTTKGKGTDESGFTKKLMSIIMNER